MLIVDNFKQILLIMFKSIWLEKEWLWGHQPSVWYELVFVFYIYSQLLPGIYYLGTVCYCNRGFKPKPTKNAIFFSNILKFQFLQRFEFCPL